MPTVILPGALLDLHAAEKDLWSWPTWATLVRTDHPPWSPEAEENPPEGWDANMVLAVRAFVEKYFNTKAKNKFDFMKRQTDEYSKGRNAWIQWVADTYRTCKVNARVDEILIEANRDPLTVMRAMKTSTLPSATDAVLWAFYEVTIYRVLGPEGLYENRMPKKGPNEFISVLLIHCWERWRKVVKRDQTAMKKKRAEVDRLWKEMSEKTPTKKDLRLFLGHIKTLMAKLERYGGDEALVAELAARKATLQAMQEALKKERGDKTRARTLPRAMLKALDSLSTAAEILVMQNELKEVLAACGPNDDEEGVAPEVPDGPDVEVEWEDGVEEFKTMTREELLEALGIPKEGIPGFSKKQSKEGLVDPWSEEFDKLAPEDLEDLEPRWHQLVGMLKMMLKMINGEPVLLMDSVGVGKTMQAVGVIALRQWYREYYTQHGRFPGLAGKRQMRSNEQLDGNFDARPSLIAVPANLIPQWEAEIKRYLLKRDFDVVLYLNKLKSRENWWQEVYAKSLHDPSHRIVLASVTALQDDARATLTINTPRWDVPVQHFRFATHGALTLFATKWGVFILDEGHEIRTLNWTYIAARFLMEISAMGIVLTATPVMTRPTDLWNMGRLLKLLAFAIENDDNALLMEREIRAAARRDRKVLKASGEDTHILNIVHGKGKAAATINESEEREKIVQWIEVIRHGFQGAVIRRTQASVDNEGQPISGLPPYIHLPLVVDLHQYELDNLDDIAKQMIEDGVVAKQAKYTSGKSFYLNIRRALTHPGCNHEFEYELPNTLEDWRNKPSKKLETLVEVLQHHLETDGAAPLAVTGPGLGNHPDHVEFHPVAGSPDKIVVYINFPSHLPLIGAVLDLYGIKYVTYDGDTTLAQRQVSLKEFKAADRDGPRVMIMSGVGLAGMNIACANHLIVVDTLWSAQEDEQLIGRVHRPPQAKPVLVYRIIAAKTPDVFLNNIAFNKAVMHQGFTGASTAIKKVFAVGSDDDAGSGDDDSDEDTEDPSEPDEDGSSKAPKPKPKAPKPKPKAQPKPRAPPKTKVPKPKPSQKQADVSDADVEVLEGPPQGKRKPRKKAQAAKSSAVVPSSSEEEDDEPTPGASGAAPVPSKTPKVTYQNRRKAAQPTATEEVVHAGTKRKDRKSMEEEVPKPAAKRSAQPEEASTTEAPMNVDDTLIAPSPPPPTSPSLNSLELGHNVNLPETPDLSQRDSIQPPSELSSLADEDSIKEFDEPPAPAPEPPRRVTRGSTRRTAAEVVKQARKNEQPTTFDQLPKDKRGKPRKGGK
ncbi:hypothetical protein SCP_1503450 [Sparassis crispa]|uniref:Helicase C-terminal domain-containing protein n=1 Tax=Sparassis crispa TaxID=139825 RepID=A0A401H4H4_9APHY|nr:hypothetical protein SCP_1503450 [Sparassis crispa]GBE89337.1 hypothetical protein SCP_1503450 [Sparassis crispa]